MGQTVARWKPFQTVAGKQDRQDSQHDINDGEVRNIFQDADLAQPFNRGGYRDRRVIIPSAIGAAPPIMAGITSQRLRRRTRRTRKNATFPGCRPAA